MPSNYFWNNNTLNRAVPSWFKPNKFWTGPDGVRKLSFLYAYASLLLVYGAPTRIRVTGRVSDTITVPGLFAGLAIRGADGSDHGPGRKADSVRGKRARQTRLRRDAAVLWGSSGGFSGS